MFPVDWWGADEGGGGGAGFGLLVLIVLLICWIDDEIKKNKENGSKKPDKQDAKSVEDEHDKCGLKIQPTSSYKEKDKEFNSSPIATVKQSSPQRYTYIENNIRMDDFTIKTDVTIDVPRRVRCGTPFIKARRQEEEKGGEQ